MRPGHSAGRTARGCEGLGNGSQRRRRQREVEISVADADDRRDRATAAGSVSRATSTATFSLFNAADGKQLLNSSVGAPIGGGVISYLANNKQYVAVAAGITSGSFMTKGGNAKVVVFGLP